MRYFINIHAGPTRDVTVAEFGGQNEAKSDMIKFVGKMLSDMDHRFWLAPELEVLATDEANRVVMRLCITGTISELSAPPTPQA